MNSINSLACALIALSIWLPAAAEEISSFEIGDAQVVYDYSATDTGVRILTLNALVAETNDSLRGLKNSDQRRLRKLGQLIYQCKLMLYRPVDGDAGQATEPDPVLVSRNYSLFTDVGLALGAGERAGIRIHALKSVDNESLFSPTLGAKSVHSALWDTLGEGSVLDLRQISVNLLQDGDLIESSESIDIVIRFPVFQVEKPVRQWSYNFDLKDFKRATRHIDENCTPDRFGELIGEQSAPSS